jgi:hypothetical protein
MLGAVFVDHRLSIRLVCGLGRAYVGYEYHDLLVTMRAEALFSGVLILDTEHMPVRTLNLNTHDQPLSPTTEICRTIPHEPS